MDPALVVSKALRASVIFVINVWTRWCLTGWFFLWTMAIYAVY